MYWFFFVSFFLITCPHFFTLRFEKFQVVIFDKDRDATSWVWGHALNSRQGQPCEDWDEKKNEEDLDGAEAIVPKSCLIIRNLEMPTGVDTGGLNIFITFVNDEYGPETVKQTEEAWKWFEQSGNSKRIKDGMQALFTYFL